MSVFRTVSCSPALSGPLYIPSPAGFRRRRGSRRVGLPAQSPARVLASAPARLAAASSVKHTSLNDIGPTSESICLQAARRTLAGGSLWLARRRDGARRPGAGVGTARGRARLASLPPRFWRIPPRKADQPQLFSALVSGAGGSLRQPHPLGHIAASPSLTAEMPVHADLYIRNDRIQNLHAA